LSFFAKLTAHDAFYYYECIEIEQVKNLAVAVGKIERELIKEAWRRRRRGHAATTVTVSDR
jgi:hypothetical protein